MRNVLIAALAALAIACTPASQEPDVRPLAAGETRVEGAAQVEDGGYPQFTVTVQPDSGDPVSLYLNAEGDADLGSEEPGSFSGKTVIAYYTTNEDLHLLDMNSATGAAVLPIGPPPSAEDRTITGTLSGADAPTSSDLPDIITITDAQGVARQFEYYVTPELVAVNGQQVTARYRAGERREVTLLRAVE
jgi:hypothetical protein